MCLNGYAESWAHEAVLQGAAMRPQRADRQDAALGDLASRERLSPSACRGSFKRSLEMPNRAWYKEGWRCPKMKFDRITIDPSRMNGQPCIRNMRLTVRRVVQLAAIYPNRDELRQEYPELEDGDIQQALLYAAAHLDDSIVELPLGHETAA
jgi:uncharacterized protein (DUF433 family)